MPEAFAYRQSIGRKRRERISSAQRPVQGGPCAHVSRPSCTRRVRRGFSAAINCFEVAGMAPDTAVQKLLETKVIASSSPYKAS